MPLTSKFFINAAAVLCCMTYGIEQHNERSVGGYEFNVADSTVCQQSFNGAEVTYLNNRDRYQDDASSLTILL